MKLYLLTLTSLFFVLSSSFATAQALLYNFNFEAGSGTTVANSADSSGNTDGTTRVNSTATDLFAAANPIAAGNTYGDFRASRSNLQFSADLWNNGNGTDAAIAGGTNAFSIVMLMRDFSSSSGGGTGDRGFFEDINDNVYGIFYTGTPSAGSVPLSIDIAGQTVTPTVNADFSNSTTGDSNGWFIFALTYSSDSDIAQVFVGKNYDSATGMWTDMTQLGDDLSLVTTSLPNAPNSNMWFGGNSSRAPKMLIDEVRIYNGALGSTELAALPIPEPRMAMMLGLGAGALLLVARRKRS